MIHRIIEKKWYCRTLQKCIFHRTRSTFWIRIGFLIFRQLTTIRWGYMTGAIWLSWEGQSDGAIWLVTGIYLIHDPLKSIVFLRSLFLVVRKIFRPLIQSLIFSLTYFCWTFLNQSQHLDVTYHPLIYLSL